MPPNETDQSNEAPSLTPKDAAAILGVTPTTVSLWADKGYLPVFKSPSGQRRFRQSDVRALLDRMAGNPEAVA